MKFLIILLLVVGCSPSEKNISTGDCILRDNSHSTGIKVSKKLKYGFTANYENYVYTGYKTFTIYRTYKQLEEYEFIDCESMKYPKD